MEEPEGAAPKARFSALDVRALARELRSLDRPRVDKVFDLSPEGWVLSLRPRGGGRAELLLRPGVFGAVVAEAPPHPESPGPFAQELRRRLAGSSLVEVPDPAGERTLAARLGRSDGTPPIDLIVEMFGTGNLLLVSEGVLLAVARPRVWAHRSLRAKSPYRPAPGRPDPWRAEASWIEGHLAGSTADRVSTLAARVGFGGPLAEELLARTGLDGRVGADREAAEVAARIHEAAGRLLEEVDRGGPAFLYRRDRNLVDVTPFRSVFRERDATLTAERLPSFGEASLEYFRRLGPSPGPRTPTRTAEGRLERTLRQQRTAIEALDREASSLSAKAERILDRFEEAERLRAGLDAEGPEVAEVRLGDLEVPLLRDRPVDASARRLFEEGKRLRAKLSGARAALEVTQRALAEPIGPAAPATGGRPPVPPPARRLWFERFRWFRSSEGVLVLAGRDAASNDQLVKKHLGHEDRYVHADLHGAASVLVKRSAFPGPEPGEATLREAGEFAVSFSKAWRAGHAAADAFWVLPDQVSKTAASGEFVARGAWVIHGTKHPLKDLPLELALGTQEIDGAPRWTAGPPEAIRRNGTARYLVTPGEERRRAEIEVELVRDLGLPRPLLQSLLPAGGLAIRRA